MVKTSFSGSRMLADQLIGLIDNALNKQANAIIHHPQFKEMEALWRGLIMLVREASPSHDVKIKILNISWPELARNIERSTDFDQSHLFELVYNREFGMPGGEPFGVMIADYNLSPEPLEKFDTISTLSHIAMVAAASFCPFIAGASPSSVGLQDFGQLDRVHDFSWLKLETSRMRWNSLRARDDTRFIGLAAPRILMRPPYAAHSRRRYDGFPFVEQVSEDAESLVWGNAAFAFACVIIRNFIECGWFADIRGVTQNEIDGGILSPEQLSPFDLGIESHGLSAQVPIEAQLTTSQEQQFSDLGIVPISSTYLSSMAIFNANQSLHAPAHYASEAGRQNARLAAMLQYVLCASRFSHYLKVMLRDDIGRISDATTIQYKLESWLASYTLGNEDAEIGLRARYPLRSAGIEVFEVPGKPGTFSCMVRLQPHFQLDDVSTSFNLIAETSPTNASSNNSPQEPQRISA